MARSISIHTVPASIARYVEKWYERTRERKKQVAEGTSVSLLIKFHTYPKGSPKPKKWAIEVMDVRGVFDPEG